MHAGRKARMRRLSYEWLDGLREIVIDSNRCPLAFSEFTLKEFERDKEGNWIDDIPDGNDHSKWIAIHLEWNGQLRQMRSCPEKAQVARLADASQLRISTLFLRAKSPRRNGGRTWVFYKNWSLRLGSACAPPASPRPT